MKNGNNDIRCIDSTFFVLSLISIYAESTISNADFDSKRLKMIQFSFKKSSNFILPLTFQSNWFKKTQGKKLKKNAKYEPATNIVQIFASTGFKFR